MPFGDSWKSMRGTATIWLSRRQGEVLVAATRSAVRVAAAFPRCASQRVSAVRAGRPRAVNSIATIGSCVPACHRCLRTLA